MAQGTAVESSLPDNELPVEELPPEEEGADTAEAAVEARAREMGWKPLAEYRGPCPSLKISAVASRTGVNGSDGAVLVRQPPRIAARKMLARTNPRILQAPICE